MKIEIGNATLYHGDCRELLPSLVFDAVITDPPWDQARNIPGADDPRGLFDSICPLIAKSARAVIQLGCYTDPNFTRLLAQFMPFQQTLWLRYICASYRGRVLVNADVGYAFGRPIKSREGARVIPSECASTGREPGELPVRGYGRNRSSAAARLHAETAAHPMPRHLKHVRWLVQWWSEPYETVCDPFLGSGTTGVACAQLGRKFIGVEIERRFFDLACERIEQAQKQQRLFA